MNIKGLREIPHAGLLFFRNGKILSANLFADFTFFTLRFQTCFSVNANELS
jgi:hypothetical protein